MSKLRDRVDRLNWQRIKEAAECSERLSPDWVQSVCDFLVQEPVRIQRAEPAGAYVALARGLRQMEQQNEELACRIRFLIGEQGTLAYNADAQPPVKYDDTLLPFLALMRAELHANSHKGDREAWLRMTLEQGLDEIRHHADKLVVPVMNQDREAIREHAADVANCAMMLADIAGVLSRE